MKYSIDKEQQYAILRLEEENLNSLISPNLKSEFIFFRNEGVKNMILDLQKVQYVDSSGLSAILTANRLWLDQGTFVIGGELKPGVKKIIEISRLDTILTILPTIQEAIDFIFLEEIERNLSSAMEEE
jgi:anti-anti-sigma factor